MMDVLLGLLWFVLVIYSPIAILIGAIMSVTSYYEIVYSDPKVKPSLIATLLHRVDYYFHANFNKNKDYKNSYIIGLVLFITGSLGVFILYKGFLPTLW